MKIFYTKKFSKDLDGIVNNIKLKNRLLQLFEQIKQLDSLTELDNVRKIRGYDDYYRIRIGDYRLGVKIKGNSIEMLRLLHRKDIYKRFP